MSLLKAFEQLPEVYQPIYNHPELSVKVSRDCVSRLDIITNILNEMSKFLNRKLKILDIGCSQGFFSFNVSNLGHEVLGVDYLDKNINLCEQLKKENKNLNISFSVLDLKDIDDVLTKNKFDLVLGLSVFHHFIHENSDGLENAKKIINNILNQCGSAIFEFALTDEPLYWSKSQPKYVHDLINKIKYNYFIDEQETHLSEIKRPIIFSSNQFIYYENFFSKIDKFKETSHLNDDFSHKNSRKYFLFDQSILKTFDLETEERKKINILESKKEIEILRDKKINISIPNLFFSKSNNYQSLIHREKYHGVTLDEYIINNKYNPGEILLKILSILETIEKKDLYFEDLRLWNFIIDDKDDLNLIDYGSLNSLKIDEYNLFNIKCDLNFIFYEIYYKKVLYPSPFRSSKLSEMHYHFPINKVIKEIWNLQVDKFSFSQVLFLFNKYRNEEINFDNSNIETLSDLKSYFYEKNIDHVSEEIKHMKLLIKNLESLIKNLETKENQNLIFINKIRNNFFFKTLKRLFYKVN